VNHASHRFTSIKKQRSPLERYDIDTPCFQSPAEASRSQPGLNQRDLHLYPNHTQNISIHQHSQIAVPDHVGNTTGQLALFAPLLFYETSARPASVPQIPEEYWHSYTADPYSESFTSNVQCQLKSPDSRYSIAPSILNSLYDQPHEMPRDTSLPRDSPGRLPQFTQRQSSDIRQNPSPILPNSQDPSLLQIQRPHLSRRRSAPTRYSNRSRSRSTSSRQSSCTPTLVGEQFSQAGSTSEANQCLTCKKVLQDERGLK
jgi:hypothetical protein